MDISCLQVRIANFKRKGKFLRLPYPNSNLKKLCLSTDYLQGKGL
jgi:hypothetical protein